MLIFFFDRWKEIIRERWDEKQTIIDDWKSSQFHRSRESDWDLAHALSWTSITHDIITTSPQSRCNSIGLRPKMCEEVSMFFFLSAEDDLLHAIATNVIYNTMKEQPPCTSLCFAKWRERRAKKRYIWLKALWLWLLNVFFFFSSSRSPPARWGRKKTYGKASKEKFCCISLLVALG